MDTPLVPATAAPTSYSPWRTIAPRFWTPTLESDEDELVAGAATGGTDALGRHAYAVEAGWSTARARPDWQVAYAYDRWRPTLFANVADDTDPWRGGEVRTREGQRRRAVSCPPRSLVAVAPGAFHSSVDERIARATRNRRGPAGSPMTCAWPGARCAAAGW